MGYLLKEALKTLCGVHQWSYAVFWKIGCQNPKLLIWEECYYETIPCSALPRIPGIESSELAFEEWEACWVSTEPRTPQVGVQAEDSVGSLLNKMMADRRVKIVGEGLVGRAAFTNDHLWILSHYYATEPHPPEARNELCQQFSSGMKTVAVIPVLNHGVVQLASTSAITENMAFVNEVKSLIVQLGCVPGALLFHNYTAGEPVSHFGVPVCFENSVSANASGSYKVKDSDPFDVDSCNQQNISSQALEFLGQPFHSLINQMGENRQGTSSKFQTPNLAQNVVKSRNGLPFSGQLESGETGAEVIPSNPELWLNQQASLYRSRMSGFNESLCVGGSSSANCSNLRLKEESILSDVQREHCSNSLSMSSGLLTSKVTRNGGSNSSGQLHTGASIHPRPILSPCSSPVVHRSANQDISCNHLNGIGLNTLNTQVPTSDLSNLLTSNHLFSGYSEFRHHPKDGKCYPVEAGQRNKGVENDLSQSLNISLAHLDDHMTLSGNISGYCDDRQKHYGNQCASFENAKYKEERAQPNSGDDLFDILGVEFKNKIFNDSWNGSLDDGPDINTKTLRKNNYASLDLQDADSDLYSVHRGNSESGIFSANGTDHLLDAVVNRVHTASKQSLDDSVSCRTTLKKISNSFDPNVSPYCGQVRASDEKQNGLSEPPKSLAKLGAEGSCSFKSECSKEDTGNYSQTSSIYGSQISSWVEQGHSKKPTVSASTAYSKRAVEVSKSNRKRLKPGENPRPRPKDRQLIQDRMKELREIVPNGAKLSIDALLERTIKHLLFLQSVTKHADKLKQTGESKIITDSGLPLKENFEGGRTWAYEVGSQSRVCPIIVEDLNLPRQMLVEMLCDERGLFLEIADIIRGLGLTILQGVMETRNDKVWARFAVEANRDVTRMEIFLSLVHLLEQTVKSGAASGNAFENDNMTAHQSFHQAASIAATGRSCSFQ